MEAVLDLAVVVKDPVEIVSDLVVAYMNSVVVVLSLVPKSY